MRCKHRVIKKMHSKTCQNQSQILIITLKKKEKREGSKTKAIT